MLHLAAGSAIAVPLEGEGDEAVGAIALYNSRKPAGFSQDDRALLRLVSANASTAVRLFRSRLERERSERLTTIGRLLSGVMHDMRTPLTVISGYVQLMATAIDPAQRADHARLILKQFDLISAMQREVLEFARGERSILVRKVYLTRFFDDIEKQLRRELDGTGVELTLQLEDRGTARFDESKMTRVLHNLARNAVEAMGPKGGKLTLRVAREGGELVVSVSDTGKGIPKRDRGQALPVLRHLGQARRHGPRPGHREEDRRRARRHDHRCSPRPRAPPSRCGCPRTGRLHRSTMGGKPPEPPAPVDDARSGRAPA